MNIILASTSIYRKILLKKLGIEFNTQSPTCDERALPHETASELSLRLAKDKVHSLCNDFPTDIIIGSDQVCEISGVAYGKPLTFSAAQQQLHHANGKLVTFFTSLAVYDPTKKRIISSIETAQIKFRQLTQTEIDNYLIIEQPYDCAGSFKCEGLGITLFDKITCDDPNILIGLPLIKLNHILIDIGYNPLLNHISHSR